MEVEFPIDNIHKHSFLKNAIDCPKGDDLTEVSDSDEGVQTAPTSPPTDSEQSDEGNHNPTFSGILKTSTPMTV